jgi:hypothetical protein
MIEQVGEFHFNRGTAPRLESNQAGLIYSQRTELIQLDQVVQAGLEAATESRFGQQLCFALFQLGLNQSALPLCVLHQNSRSGSRTRQSWVMSPG